MRGFRNQRSRAASGHRFPRNQRSSGSRTGSLAAAGIFALAATLSYGAVRLLSPAIPEPSAALLDLGHDAAPTRAPEFGPAELADAGPDLRVARIADAWEEPEHLGPAAPVWLFPSSEILSGSIKRGSSLAQALSDHGVPSQSVHEITRALRGVFDFRRSRPGDLFSLVESADGEILSFEYRYGRETAYRIERTDAGDLQASQEEVPTEARTVVLGGVIASSLFDAIRDLDEGAELVQRFSDIFVWDFDFSRESRPGDEFRLIFEKRFDSQGFREYGQVLAASYRSGQRELLAFYFEDEGGYGDYYTPEGSSVRRTFLRAPVKYRRISSRFTKHRMHPILRRVRPHEGIDYAAPTGTPVWSVADGRVIYQGWNGGFGRLVKIRHNNGYVSFYGHLSRYAAELKVGSKVEQRQVIGYVGSTGLSTGPHLDYRLKIAGRFVDPLRVRFPRGTGVPVSAKDRFAKVKQLRLAELRADAGAGNNITWAGM